MKASMSVYLLSLSLQSMGGISGQHPQISGMTEEVQRGPC